MTNANQKLCLKVYPHTIYNDIVDLPDPMLLGLTIHYYNHSDTALYMKIFGSGPSPWSSNAVELGSLASGANAYINLDNFLSRTKPTEALTEELTLTLKGYTDSGYSDLKYEFSRTCTVVFIKSDDGTWTTDYLNNFNDGTIQSWAERVCAGDQSPSQDVSLAVTSDYVLSTPYSLKQNRKVCLENTCYWIAVKYAEILLDSTIKIHLGKLFNDIDEDYIPKNKWMRLVIPLPINTTTEIAVRLCTSAYDNYGAHRGIWEIYKSFTTPNKTTVYAIFNIRFSRSMVSSFERQYTWLDDFKIISK